MTSTIFEVCDETSWDLLGDKTPIVDLARQACSVVPKTDPMPEDSAVMVCPMERIIRMLRNHVVRSSPIATEQAQGHGVELSDRTSAGVQHR